MFLGVGLRLQIMRTAPTVLVNKILLKKSVARTPGAVGVAERRAGVLPLKSEWGGVWVRIPSRAGAGCVFSGYCRYSVYGN